MSTTDGTVDEVRLSFKVVWMKYGMSLMAVWMK